MAKNPRTYFATASLDYAPDIAKALGEIIIAWSYSEFVTLALFQSLTDRSYGECAAIFGSIPTFDGRVRLIKNIAKSSGKKDEHERIFTALEGLRGLGATRNSYVHQSWTANADGTETVTFNYLEPKGSPGRRREIKAHDLLNHAEAVRRKATNLCNEILNVFPRALIEAPTSIPILRVPKKA